MEKEVRLDKWLWSVRLYKTRALASDACRLGKVIINNIPAKASYQVKIGDIIYVNIEQIHRKVKVIALVNNRQGAKLVDKYMEDLTPKEEYERIEITRKFAFEKRDRGSGRPTKRERRDIDNFKD